MDETKEYGDQDFILEIDTRDYTVRGTPDLKIADGLICVMVGHLARLDQRISKSPTARIIEAYNSHGAHFSAKLLGQYAAVIVDRNQNKVILSQDSLGIIKLAYRISGHLLTVSSDIGLLLGHVGEMAFNERYFCHQIVAGFPLREDTPFSGINRLAYGKTIVFDRNKPRSIRPWQPSLVMDDIGLDEAGEHLRANIDTAVTACLPSKGRLACELSGGLDSTTVAATVVQHSPAIIALTFESDRRRAGDDEEYAALASRLLGLKQFKIDMDKCLPYSTLPHRFAAESGGEMLVARQDAYSKVVREQEVSVILTGAGGDAIFGYGGLAPVHLADPWRMGHVLQGIHNARSWAHLRGNSRHWTHYAWNVGLRYAWKHLNRLSTLHDHSSLPQWINVEFVRRHKLDRLKRPQIAPHVDKPGQQYLWEEIYELAAHLDSPARRAVPASTRHPLLHRPLVEFMLSLPLSLRRNAQGDRVLQRQALMDRLPEKIRIRKTKGSTQELYERALMSNPNWVQSMTKDPRLASLGWVDHKAWQEAIDRARCGVFETSKAFEVAMLTELWMQTLERISPPKPPALVPVLV